MANFYPCVECKEREQDTEKMLKMKVKRKQDDLLEWFKVPADLLEE